MFKQRTSAPSGTEKFWTRPEHGGLNLCIQVRDNGSVIPNCTGYAYGRFLEEAHLSQCRLSRANAENWFGNADGYPRGSTPKLGAVMCWRKGSTSTSTDGYGHVAIVEQINPDGSVECSMSNYPLEGKPLPAWERKTYYPPYNTSTGLTFQGFIYNPALEVDPLQTGMNIRQIAGVDISIYKVAKGLSQGLIRAKNGLQKIELFDMDGISIYERCGNDFFQMKADQADPIGTVYGPRVCIDGHVDMPTDSEHFIYYMIKKDGSVEFGDWDGQWRDPSDIEVMFSPGVIFYEDAGGNRRIKYAPTMASYTAAQWRAYIGRTSDGTFLKGVSKGPLTPEQMWDYLHERYDIVELCFMDGGSANAGSAQQTYWNGYKSVKFQSSERAVGDMLVTYQRTSANMIPGLEPDQLQPSEMPSETIPEPAIPDETEKEEETPMEDNKPVEEPKKDTGWVDPEPQISLISQRIAALLSVKSLLTLTLTGVFSYLVINQIAIPQEFSEVYKVCIYFFFGYSIGKTVANR